MSFTTTKDDTTKHGLSLGLVPSSIDETSDSEMEVASDGPLDDHEDEDWPRCTDCGWELRDGLCTECNLDNDGSSSTEEAPATPLPIASDSTTDINEPSLPMQEPSAAYCVLDDIWRCTLCLWEIEGWHLDSDSAVISCASGHTIDDSKLPAGWRPADYDSEYETSSSEWDYGDRNYLPIDDEDDSGDDDADRLDGTDDDEISDEERQFCAAGDSEPEAEMTEAEDSETVEEGEAVVEGRVEDGNGG